MLIKNIFQNKYYNIISLFLLTCIFSFEVYWIANFNDWRIFKYAIVFLGLAAGIITLCMLLKFKISKCNIALLILWCLFLPLFYFLIKYRNSETFISGENLRIFNLLLLDVIIFYPLLLFCSRDINFSEICNKKTMFCITAAFFVFLFFYNPVNYYLSSPSDINKTITGFVLFAVFISLSCTALFYICFLITGKKAIFARIMFFIFLISLVYSLCFKLNTGLLDSMHFHNETAILKMPVLLYLADSAIIAILWILSGYLLKKKENIVQFISAVFLCSSFLLASYKIIKNIDSIPLVIKDENTTATMLPETAYKNHIFSKTGKNIVFILADMYNGNYFGRLLDDDKKYNDLYSGFTYFPDSLSISSFTVASLPALLGGEEYIPVKLNGNGKTGKQEIGEAASKFFNDIKNSGYEVTVTQPGIFFTDEDTHGASIEYQNNYLRYWQNKNNYNYKKADNTSILFMLSIFNSSPMHWKYIIYDKSGWIILRKSILLDQIRSKAIEALAYIDLLPEVSSTKDTKNHFFYIHNDLPHNPYGIDSDGNVVREKFPVNNDIASSSSAESAFLSAKKFTDVIGNWILWMKDNNVYDNTAIIIFSDHGNNFNDNDIESNFQIRGITRAQTLLLVKGFKERGKVKIDKTEISSADLISILKTETGISFSGAKDLKFEKNRTTLN
jgi:uncharacterized membrane protein (Fun14 family)